MDFEGRLADLYEAGETEQAREFAKGIILSATTATVHIEDDHICVTHDAFSGRHAIIESGVEPSVISRGTYTVPYGDDELTINTWTMNDHVAEKAARLLHQTEQSTDDSQVEPTPSERADQPTVADGGSVKDSASARWDAKWRGLLPTRQPDADA